MGFSSAVRAEINNGTRTFEDRMEAKSHHLHGKLRQNVPINPALTEKKRRHETEMDRRALAGTDPW